MKKENVEITLVNKYKELHLSSLRIDQRNIGAALMRKL